MARLIWHQQNASKIIRFSPIAAGGALGCRRLGQPPHAQPSNATYNRCRRAPAAMPILAASPSVAKRARRVPAWRMLRPITGLEPRRCARRRLGFAARPAPFWRPLFRGMLPITRHRLMTMGRSGWWSTSISSARWSSSRAASCRAEGNGRAAISSMIIGHGEGRQYWHDAYFHSARFSQAGARGGVAAAAHQPFHLSRRYVAGRIPVPEPFFVKPVDISLRRGAHYGPSGRHSRQGDKG